MYGVLGGGRHERRRLIGRPRHRLEDIINVDHKEIRLEVFSWIYVDQNIERWQIVLNMITNFQVP
jgi:hypothetical protein